MKILVHMNQLLYPADTGGKIRSSKLFEHLSKEHDITIVCFRRPDESDEQVNRMMACCSRLETIDNWHEARPSTPAFYRKLAANLISPYPYIVQKYYDRRMKNKIRQLLAEDDYDVLLCDFLQPSLNVIDLPFRPKVLFEHNVESVLRQRHYRQARNPLAKAYLYLQWRKLDRYENRAAHAFDHCIMVSERDQETLAELYGATNTSAVPLGVDVEFFQPADDEPAGNDIVFTGSMDWLPNEDGVQFFADEILPRIEREVPDVRFWIVGRNPTQIVQRLAQEHDNIEVTGTVDDIRPYVQRAKVYVVPLRVGGGTRIKIFEAMAMAKATVSTTLGAEGLPVTDGENIHLIDDPELFAQKTVQLLKNDDERQTLGDAACRFVRENYTWDVAAKRFGEFCERAAQERKDA